MFVPEIHQPGQTYVGLIDDHGNVVPLTDEQRTYAELVNNMSYGLCDAGVALWLYIESKRGRDPMDVEHEYVQAMFARQQELLSKLPPGATEQERQSAIGYHRDLKQVVKRERWEKGEWPATYLNRFKWVHAKSFLFALDEIAKSLGVLASASWAPQTIADANIKWDNAFEHLKAVRDSAHHQEDRSLGLGKWKRKIKPKPFKNEWIEAPNGLKGPCLSGDNFGMMAEDGHYREVSVTADSLRVAGDVVQQVVNAWSYDGPADWLP